MKLSAMVTMEDHAMAWGTWGRVGVYHILARLKEVGITRVYWRSLGDGQSSYHSRLTDNKLKIKPLRHPIPEVYTMWGTPERADYINQVMNFDEIDMFKIARKRAAELNIEFHVWHEARGEDHCCSLYSEFVERYPQFLSIDKFGNRADTELGWAFPEVMDRRVGLFREVIGYDPDSVFFDFMKSGDLNVSRFDPDGYWRMGYEPPMVEGFKKETGLDPWKLDNKDQRWLAYRAGYVTDYLRKCKKIRDTLFPKVKLGLMPMTPKYGAVHMGAKENYAKIAMAEDPLANLEDHKTWIEQGLIEIYSIDHCTRTLPEMDVLEFGPKAIRDVKNRLGNSIKYNFQADIYANRGPQGWTSYLDKIVDMCEREDIDEVILRETNLPWAYNELWAAVKAKFRPKTVKA